MLFYIFYRSFSAFCSPGISRAESRKGEEVGTMDSPSYELAKEGGRTGYDLAAVHSEIRLEFDGASQDDFIRLKKELLFFLEDLYEQALKKKKNNKGFVRFVVTDCLVTYASIADHGLVAGHNPAIVLSADKHPLYNVEMTPVVWRETVEFCARELGQRFHPPGISVSHSERELKILRRIPRPDEAV